MKKILLTICLISSNVFATTADTAKILSQIDEQIKIIEKTISSTDDKSSDRHYFETLSDKETKIWGHITELYELYRVNNVSERYLFLLEATNAMSVPMDQRGFYLEEWATTVNKRAIEIIGLSPTFYKKWKNSMKSLNSEIKDFNSFSRTETSSPLASLTQQTEKIKELAKSIEALPPKLIERKVIVEEVRTTNNYPLLATSFLAGIALMFAFRKKKIETVEIPVAQPVRDIPAMAAFNRKTMIAQAAEKEEDFFANPRKLNLEEISKRCLERNQHLFSLATLDVQHQNPSPFDTDINIPADKLAEAMNWMIKGIISLKNTANENETKLDWVCKKNKDRVSVEFILRNVIIDSQKLQENAIINGDGSAPAHFGRCEQILANHFPTVKVKPAQNHTIISLGLESYTTTAMSH